MSHDTQVQHIRDSVKAAQAALDDARTDLANLTEGPGHTPVDLRRFERTNEHLRNALASLDWFDRLYPDERA